MTLVEKHPEILILTGPTASGKTGAGPGTGPERLRAEVVALDSMTLYRGMDTGTAKPTPGERARVPHHLIDVLDPWESGHVAWWLAEADRVVGGHPGPGPPAAVRRRHAVLPQGPAARAVRRAPRRRGRPPALPSKSPRPRATAALHRLLRGGGSGQRGAAARQRRAAGGPGAGGPRTDRPAALGTPGPVMGRPGGHGPGADRRRAALPVPGRAPGRTPPAHRPSRPSDDRRRLARTRSGGCGGLPHPLSREASRALGYAEWGEHLDGLRGFAETLELVRVRSRQYAKRQETWFRSLPGLVRSERKLTFHHWHVRMI